MSLVSTARRTAVRRLTTSSSNSHKKNPQSQSTRQDTTGSFSQLLLLSTRQHSSSTAAAATTTCTTKKNWNETRALSTVAGEEVSCATVLAAGSSRSDSFHGRSWVPLMGASLLALGGTSASLFYGSSSDSKATRCEAPLEAHPGKGSSSFESVGVRNNNNHHQQQPPPILATSALYMDSVSMIYHTDHAAIQPETKRNTRADLDGEERDRAVSTSLESGFNRHYDLSIRAIKGARVTMEDAYFVAPGGRFVAVFDGHGGGHVSSYLKENLYQLAKQALRKKHWEIDSDYEAALAASMLSENNHHNKDDKTTRAPISLPSHVAALRTAFMQAEEHVLQEPKWSKMGSTAVAVWVHEGTDGARTLVSANVGDSRAILSRQGQAVDLTSDHKPNEEREQRRIKRLGGTIEWDALAKVHRVENLSLSRAIGDSFAKPIVSSEVEIKLFPVVEGKDEFILLASDGLWDVFSSQECVNYVKDRFETELSRQELTSDQDMQNCQLVLRRNMARSLCKEAVRRGSGDNICVLIVWLKDGAITSTSSSQHSQ